MPVIKRTYNGDGSRKDRFKPYLVRWTDGSGRQHEKSFLYKREADDWRASVNSDKRASGRMPTPRPD